MISNKFLQKQYNTTFNLTNIVQLV